MRVGLCLHPNHPNQVTVEQVGRMLKRQLHKLVGMKPGDHICLRLSEMGMDDQSMLDSANMRSGQRKGSVRCL